MTYRREVINLSSREKHVLFLKGALNAVDRGRFNIPTIKELYVHFSVGASCVATGHIRISDPDAFMDHIRDVESGLWPPR